MKQPKRYKLLQNLPNVLAGAEFVPSSALAYACINQGKWHIEYCNEIVENNSDWFELIQGKTNSLWGDWLDNLMEKVPKQNTIIKEILQGKKYYSEQQLELAEEKAFHAAREEREGWTCKRYPTFQSYKKSLFNEPVTVGRIISQKLLLNNLKAKPIGYQSKIPIDSMRGLINDKIYTNSIPVVLFKNLLDILHIDYDAILPAMFATFKHLKATETKEDIKQKPHGYMLWENEESLTKYANHLKELMCTINESKQSCGIIKEWEIISIIRDNDMFTKERDGYFHAPNRHAWREDTMLHPGNMEDNKIHSVKRLSDGEVFTLGDFIRVKEPPRKGWSDPIIGFIVIDNTMVAEFETWRQPLNDIERMHKDIHVTQPLNTSERNDVGVKDWEVESIRIDLHGDSCPRLVMDKLVIYNFLRGDERYSSYKIHSVRRLPDCSVWTLGEKITVPHNNAFPIMIWHIKSFEIKESGIWVSFHEHNTKMRLSDLRNPFSNNNKSLLRTEDGKDLCENDEYWYVDTNFKLHGPKRFHGTSHDPSFKRYSKKKNAEEYILMKNPCLSVDDVHSNLNLDLPNFIHLKKLAEAKINNLK